MRPVLALSPSVPRNLEESVVEWILDHLLIFIEFRPGLSLTLKVADEADREAFLSGVHWRHLEPWCLAPSV